MRNNFLYLAFWRVLVPSDIMHNAPSSQHNLGYRQEEHHEQQVSHVQAPRRTSVYDQALYRVAWTHAC